MILEDTITAIATPNGRGAISIVRVSGKDALTIVNKLFSKDIKKFNTHTIHYGKILNENNDVIDTVMLAVMLAPNSYTGENSIEIQCHGSPIVTQKVLRRVLSAGARAAHPGEFTFRAFINKKIDLTQAEAVQELISANNDLAIGVAKNNLQGVLSKEIKHFQKTLTDIAAILEAWVDFPEEGLEFATNDEVIQKLDEIVIKMQNLSSTFDEGKLISQGINLCIIGKPNVGKSSLLNAFVKKDRAIVTNIAGTTRDLIEEDIKFNNLHFHLIDTAGIHNTDSSIEQEGIKRSKQAAKLADLVLLMLDASEDLTEDDTSLINYIDPKKTIIIWNKIDLKKPCISLDHKNTINISAKNNIGLEDLKNEIEKKVFQKRTFTKDEIIITNSRHKQALDNAIINALKVSKNLQEDISAEFISSDMKACLNELKKIIGTDVSEDILSSIFSKFCIGK